MTPRKRNVLQSVLLISALSIVLACGRVETTKEPIEERQVVEAELGVILVPMEYSGGMWKAGPEDVKILPCEPPTERQVDAQIGPAIRLLGLEGEVVYERYLRADPRIVLYEGPTDMSNVLDSMSVVLRLPLVDGASSFEFYADSLLMREVDKEPTLQVDLLEPMRLYEAMEGADEASPCQRPRYKPDQLKG